MEENSLDRQALIALNLLPGFGPRTFLKLREGGGGYARALAPGDGFLERAGLAGPDLDRLRRAGPASAAGEEIDRAAAAGARIVTFDDAGYPALLRHIYDPPPVLYLRGSLERTPGPAVAVVGSRRPTPYGLATAETIGRELAAAGINVVSGLARGIDTAAHRGALAAGGVTTAVLGTGIDLAYPAENARLIGEIAERGAVLSEFPVGTWADRFRFPRRNRVISGLAQAVIVVEAGERSGALITADFALDQGREVLAVPGPVSSGKSAGCHRLINDGARLYTGIGDLLAPPADGRPEGAAGPADAPGGEESSVLGALEGGPLFLDEIIARAELPASRASATLLSLELKGRVRRFPGQRYARI